MGIYSIGLDVGTQSTKCVVYDLDQNVVVGRGAVSYGLDSARHGQAEQDPQVWIKACRDSIIQALSTCDDTSKVKAISVSGQQHGLVVVDAHDHICRPAKLWCDLESAKEAQELSLKFNTTIVPSFTITKLLWLKNNEPQHYSKIAKIFLPHDYINYWLTGEWCMEASDASGTGFLDPLKREWDPERILAIGAEVAQMLPPITKSDAIIGTLKPNVAKELGLSPDQHIIVGPGGGDNAMSALGVGAVRPGVWVVSLGTSGTLFGPSTKPVVDKTGTICAFCDATGGSQGLPLVCTVNCTGVTEQVREMCGQSHQELTDLASKEPAGSHGVTFLPYLAGERTPNWPHATGTILGLRPGLMRPGILYRAAMEGATFSLLAGLESMKQHGDIEAKELRVIGGGSKNPVWRQIIADCFQMDVTIPLIETESAAFGAALQAAALQQGVNIAEFVASRVKLEEDVLHPIPDNISVYKTAFENFSSSGKLLFGNMYT